jgi:hypothetical protein
MTVKNLIKILKQLNKDAEVKVLVNGHGGESGIQETLVQPAEQLDVIYLRLEKDHTMD